MGQINYKDYIEVNPEIRFGKPVLKDTRITVYDVISWIESGRTNAEIINDFPQLKSKMVFVDHLRISDKIEQLNNKQYLTSEQLDEEIEKW